MGLDAGKREMVQTFSSGGYRAKEQACRNWLLKHRAGAHAAVDGGVATYTLYRQAWLRWHHLEELSPQAGQARLLSQHGVWADRGNLQIWLKAADQQLPVLGNNEDIHAHPCGEYVLDRLQKSDLPVNVVSGLLRESLVKATVGE